MSKPLSPTEVAKSHDENIPKYVIDAVNTLLVLRYKKFEFYIRQDELIAEILSKNPSFIRENLFINNQLDFESLFRSAGWKIEYQSPQRGSTSGAGAYWSFSR